MLLTHDVVVCVHNAPDYVERCVRSITYQREISRIILVNDASSPATTQLLARLAQLDDRIEIIHLSRRSGYTKAANTGLRASSGDLVTLLNSDGLLSPGWDLKTARCFHGDSALGIVGPLSNAASYQSVPSNVGTSSQTAVNEIPARVLPIDIDDYCHSQHPDGKLVLVPLVHGFCFTVSRRCIDVVGMLDEELFPKGYGEETDYCFRAADQGFRLGVVLDTYVYHAKSKSYADVERKRLMSDGWAELVSKYGLRRLQHAIKVMEAQPQLRSMRRGVYEKFYTSSEAHWFFSESRWAASASPKCVAFYLPQFHPTPENDANWGEGFSEWFNVVDARPRFPCHEQPKLPGELGFYDLRAAEVISLQAKLARTYGVSAFCLYYYRFGSRRLLYKPTEVFISGAIDMPFLLCWANESWTRAWDGASDERLFEQEYDDVTLDGLANDFARSVKSEKYVHIDGRPVFIIYHGAGVPQPQTTVSDIRSRLTKACGLPPLLGTVYSPDLSSEARQHFDFVVQFPPHRIPRNRHRRTIHPSLVGPFEPERGDCYEAYTDVVEQSLDSRSHFSSLILGACPDWDNTPRRQTRAHTLIGSSPTAFSKWVSLATAVTTVRSMEHRQNLPMIFVNAWNEWAEGAVLEPSKQHGRSYLEALAEGLFPNSEEPN